MKRREIIKQLSAIPLAGGFISMDPFLTSPFHSGESDPTSYSNSITDGTLVAGPDIYRSIGVEPVINCRGTITVIGGSLELPEVRKAMDFAAQNFVQIDELAMAVGQRLAKITGAEWGMVSAGCSAGLKHVTVACVTDGDPEKLIRVPNLEGFEKTEVIIPRYSRNQYDHAIRNVGVKIVMVDTAEELQNAINPRTAMIYLLSASQDYETGPLSIENIYKIAGPRNIPILVDAAAEIFTIPNVHLQRGATIVAYSGGKAIRGPQCAGLLLGRKDILLAAWQASAPHHGTGRDNKLGKEEHIGMLAAIETWTKRDHAAEEKMWISWLNNISKRVSDIKSVKTTIQEPKGLDNRSALMSITWDPEQLNITSEEVAEDFAKNKPRIALGCRSDKKTGTTSLSISAWMMQPGDDKIVAERIYEILTRKHPKKSSAMEAPAANIVGHWDVSVGYYTGKGDHKLFIEKQDGNWIQGMYKSSFSMQEIAGTIEGNQIKLLSNYNAPGDSIPFTFAGTLAGEEISGTLYMGEYHSAKFTAKRSEYKRKPDQVSVPNYGRRNGNAW
ncbi:MAG TPA: PLP-dependent transferase [Bacteroidales bacterium]|nr:PLP-dependent transferase [Bacteroidales bacterium]HPT20376.1 PLP-dependent transferase [Bacteroidales bacterium]